MMSDTIAGHHEELDKIIAKGMKAAKEKGALSSLQKMHDDMKCESWDNRPVWPIAAALAGFLVMLIAIGFGAGWMGARPKAADPASYGLPGAFGAEPMSVYGLESEVIATLYPNGKLTVKNRDYERVIRTLLVRQLLFMEQKKMVQAGIDRLKAAYDEKLRTAAQENEKTEGVAHEEEAAQAGVEPEGNSAGN